MYKIHYLIRSCDTVRADRIVRDHTSRLSGREVIVNRLALAVAAVDSAPEVSAVAGGGCAAGIVRAVVQVLQKQQKQDEKPIEKQT